MIQRPIQIIINAFCCLILLTLHPIHSATCISNGNGNWATGGTWSCGTVPTCGDSVIIQAGHTVTITSQQDLRSCGSLFRMAVYGTLKFTSGNKLRLACNSRVYILSGGSLVPGSGGGSSNELEICGETMWESGDGTYSGPGCFPSTLTACAAVLPIELLKFEQISCLQKNIICLGWETASEENNNYFELERSLNGLEFSVVKTIPSKAPGGDSKTKLIYETTDEDPPPTWVYYRLKQTDFDLSYSFSPILYLDNSIEEKITMSVLPNPNNGWLMITVTGQTVPQRLKMAIKNTTGENVYEENFIVSKEENKKELVLKETLLSGIYFCVVNLKDNFLTFKIVIED